MNIRPFNVNTDLVFVNEWLSARAMKPMKLSDFPEIGFLVEEGELAVACAFLRRVEGNYGIYDSQATNPKAPSAIRHEALNLLFLALCEAARALNLKHLVAHTTDESTLQRSHVYGFKQLLGTVIAKDLSPPQGE